jgi:hypothetical protein
MESIRISILIKDINEVNIISLINLCFLILTCRFSKLEKKLTNDLDQMKVEGEFRKELEF